VLARAGREADEQPEESTRIDFPHEPDYRGPRGAQARHYDVFSADRAPRQGAD
jgi:hypothetical protein